MEKEYLALPLPPTPPPLSGWCVSARHDSAKNANFTQNNVLEKSARLLRVSSPIKKSKLMSTYLVHWTFSYIIALPFEFWHKEGVIKTNCI